MRKYKTIFILGGVFLLLAFAAPDADGEALCTQCLKELGWETRGDFASEEIVLPKKEEKTWKNYLAMQTEYPLASYSGCAATRYTVEIANYPLETGPVYAHIYVADGRILGGDIMTTALTGFMHPLVARSSIHL